MSAAEVRKRLDVVLLALFLGALYAPTVDLIVRADEVRGPTPEFRNAAPKPGFPRTAKQFYKFPTSYEAHFNDTFGLRDKLLRWNSFEKVFWLGTSPSKLHLQGRDGWFFYAGNASMQIIRGAHALTVRELVAWQAELEARSRMHASAGRRYLFTLVPNKETIYPERLPDPIHANGPTRMDQFTAWMRTHSNVDVLDMRPAFHAARAADTGPMDPLYTPHGTHWTSRGVYTAYAAIVGHLSEGTAFAGPRPLSDFAIVPHEIGADSFASNLYLLDVLVQPGDGLYMTMPNGFTVIEQKTSSPQWVRTQGNRVNLLPHTIIFHDSFGPFIAATLAQSFQTLDMCEGAHDHLRISVPSTRIVVEMFVERYLYTHAPERVLEEPLPESSGSSEGLAHVLFDLRTTPESARAVAGLALARTPSGGFRLERQGSLDGLVLGPLKSPPRGEVRLQIDLEADSSASLDVMWRRTDGPAFTRVARTQLPIGPGRATRDIQLPRLAGEWELMMRPTEMEPAIIVHGCTIRSAQAP